MVELDNGFSLLGILVVSLPCLTCARQAVDRRVDRPGNSRALIHESSHGWRRFGRLIAAGL